MVTSGALLAIVLVGFSPSFYLKVFFETPELPFYLHVHGALLTVWFVLFFAQTMLIASRRTDLHRRLGVVGLVWAVPVVIVSTITNLLAVPRLVGLARPEEIAEVLAEGGPIVFANFTVLVFFAICVASAAYFRRSAEIHKRLMLLASISIVPPAIDRLWRVSGVDDIFLFLDLSVLALLIVVPGVDWFIRRRPHWVLLGGVVVLFVVVSAGAGFGATEVAKSWLLSS